MYGLDIPYASSATDLTKTIGDIMKYLKHCALGVNTYILPRSKENDKVMKAAFKAANKKISEEMWLLQALFHKVFAEQKLNFVNTTVGAKLMFKSKGKVDTLTKEFKDVVIHNQLHDVEYIYSGRFEIEFYHTPDVSIDAQKDHVYLIQDSLTLLNESLQKIGTHVIVFRVEQGSVVQNSQYKVVKQTPKKFELRQILELSPLSSESHEAIVNFKGQWEKNTVNKLLITDEKDDGDNVIDNNPMKNPMSEEDKKVCRAFTEHECAVALVTKLKKKISSNLNEIPLDVVNTQEGDWKKAWRDSNILFEFFSNIGYVFASLRVKVAQEVEFITMLVKYNSLFVNMDKDTKNRSMHQYTTKYKPIKEVHNKDVIPHQHVAKDELQYKERWFLSRYNDAMHDLEIRSLRDLSNTKGHFASFPKSTFDRHHDDMEMFLGVGGDDDKLVPYRKTDFNPYESVQKDGKNKSKKKPKPLPKGVGWHEYHREQANLTTVPEAEEESSTKNKIKVQPSKSAKKNPTCVTYNTPHYYQFQPEITLYEDHWQTGEGQNAWICFCKFANLKRVQAQAIVSDYMVSLGKPSFLELRGYIHFITYQEEGLFRAYLHRFEEAQQKWEEVWDEFLEDLEAEFNRLYKLNESSEHQFVHCCTYRDAREYYSPYLFWYRDFSNPWVQKYISIKELQEIEKNSKFIAREVVACAMIYKKFPGIQHVGCLCVGIINSIIFANPYISFAMFSHILDLFYDYLKDHRDDWKDPKLMDAFIATMMKNISKTFADKVLDIISLPEYNCYIKFYNDPFIPRPWRISGLLIKYDINKLIHPNDECASEFDDRNITIKDVEDPKLQEIPIEFSPGDIKDEDKEFYQYKLEPVITNKIEELPELPDIPDDESVYDDIYDGIVATPLTTGTIALPTHTGVNFNNMYRFIMNADQFVDRYHQNQAENVYVWAYYNNLFGRIDMYTHVNGFKDGQCKGYVNIAHDTYDPDVDEHIDSDQLHMMTKLNVDGWASDIVYARYLFKDIYRSDLEWRESTWMQFDNYYSIAVMLWKCLCNITQKRIEYYQLKLPPFKRMFDIACKYHIRQRYYQSQTAWHLYNFLSDFRLYVSPTVESVKNGFFFLSKFPVDPKASIQDKLETISRQFMDFHNIYVHNNTDYARDNVIVAYPCEILHMKRSVRRCPYYVNCLTSVLMDIIVSCVSETDDCYSILSQFLPDYCNYYIKQNVLMSNVACDWNSVMEELRNSVLLQFRQAKSLKKSLQLHLDDMKRLDWLQMYHNNVAHNYLNENQESPHITNSKYLMNLHKKLIKS
jgi:hypothetical protein